MKKILLIFICIFSIFAHASAQKNEVPEIKVYCKVRCIGYNLFKSDVNALVDFGIAETGEYANGWIYNPDTDKKMSFASPVSVLSYMSRRGWEYKDTVIMPGDGKTDDKTVWYFILSKDMPGDCTPEDIIGDIDYRNK